MKCLLIRLIEGFLLKFNLFFGFSICTGKTGLHLMYNLLSFILGIFTPHAQRERGKVIDRGVHIYIYIYMSVVGKKN